MESLKEAIDDKDYVYVKEIAHSIKASVRWVGATKIHYAAYYIQKFC